MLLSVVKVKVKVKVFIYYKPLRGRGDAGITELRGRTLLLVPAFALDVALGDFGAALFVLGAALGLPGVALTGVLPGLVLSEGVFVSGVFSAGFS